MKTFKKILCKREYSFNGGYWSKLEKGKSYCELTLYFDFKEGLRFVAEVPNCSMCCRNPINALMIMLEHENVKGEKYDDLKDNMRSKGLHKKL